MCAALPPRARRPARDARGGAPRPGGRTVTRPVNDASPANALRWDAESLWDALSPQLPGLSIEVVEQLESTNSELVERLRRTGTINSAGGPGRRAVDLQPTLLVAVHQTRGRGRLGRGWQSTGGASLTFSLALGIDRADWSGLSLAVGVAIAEALDPAGGRLRLKWPNDLWLMEPGAIAGARKLGGILVETVQVGQRRLAVIGVGLNVLPQRIHEVEVEPAWLAEIDPAATPPTALAALAPPLVQALKQFNREGFAPFVSRYAARDALQAAPVTTTDAACPSGTVAGIDADGALLVDALGTIHRVVSGMVSVRPVGLAPAAN